MAYDLVIKNGTVVDGTGAPRFKADIAIKERTIVEVGKLNGAQADSILDADGLIVSPGFFDTHTHYDVQLSWDRLATPSCWHGVTSVLMGNCGYTIAPGRPSDSEYLMKLMSRVEGIPYEVIQAGVDWNWESFGEFLAQFRENLGINVAAQVGHSALRYYAMGEDAYQREATDDEIKTMATALREGLSAGAVGFSTSQSATQVGAYGEPVPSRFSSYDEIRQLCNVLTEFSDGIIAVNPNPGAGYVNPEFQELLTSLSVETGRPVLWNSLMHRRDRPDGWREMLDFMDRAEAKQARVYAIARCQRLDIQFDLHHTMMLDRLPAWKEIIDLPYEDKRKLFANEHTRAMLKIDWDQPDHGPGMLADTVRVDRTRLAQNKNAEGALISDLAAKNNQHAVDYLLDLALSENLDTKFFYTPMNGDPAIVEEIVKDSHCLPGVSDAGAHLDHEIGVDFTSLFLRHWVGDRKVMSLEEGVRRLTSMPAQLLGLRDRGIIKEGKAADIVIFEPEKLRALPWEMESDLPDGSERIIQRAEGIQAVIVNGETLIKDNTATGAMPGQLLTTARVEP